MNAADHIATALYKQGVTHVYELVGGMITFMLDALHRHGQISIVSMHHEQCAGFAAEGHGRMTGQPSVAFATSGPGATNLLTAIGSCFFDSVPAVFITGQVNRHEQRGTRAIRQLGFQETDIVSMAAPVTKAAWQVHTPQELPHLLEKAFALAVEGRPGPVLIDIPMDVQRAEVADWQTWQPPAMPLSPPETADFMARMAATLSTAQRPLILAGGGCVAPGLRDDFMTFAQRAGIPVAHTLMAVDLLPAQHPLRMGMIGSYGNRWTNTAAAKADWLLVLGSRLDVRQTGADTIQFAQGKTIFHVDIEPGEINNRLEGCHPLVCDLGVFLKQVKDKLRVPEAISQRWIQQITADKTRWPDTAELKDIDGINPNQFVRKLSEVSRCASAFVTDVGQHQMWVAQSVQMVAGQRHLTSGGMGAMGFSLPAAIGACFASGKRPVVVVAGDGGFQLNLQELQTVARNRLPIKIVILNNGCHGMVRQFQESYFKSRYQSTLWGYSAPDFNAVAKAYDIAAWRVDTQEAIDAGLSKLWEEADTPFLLEVAIAPSTNVYPKMAFGKPISDMEPFVKPTEMEST